MFPDRDSLVHIDLSTQRIPLGRVDLPVGPQSLVELGKVYTQVRGFIVIMHSEM